MRVFKIKTLQGDLRPLVPEMVLSDVICWVPAELSLKVQKGSHFQALLESIKTVASLLSSALSGNDLLPAFVVISPDISPSQQDMLISEGVILCGSADTEDVGSAEQLEKRLTDILDEQTPAVRNPENVYGLQIDPAKLDQIYSIAAPIEKSDLEILQHYGEAPLTNGEINPYQALLDVLNRK
jgi:hypothetical protein